MTPEAALRRWRDRPVSALGSHEGRCCRTARSWVQTMELSRFEGVPEPVRITARYPWGPSGWPLHWCEAVRSGELDCGALASLAREAFSARGSVTVPVQVILEVPKSTATHWAARWEAAGRKVDWISGRFAYHEACGIPRPDGLRIWDPSRGEWLVPGGTSLYRVVAIRITRFDQPEDVRWETARLRPDSWQVLGESLEKQRKEGRQAGWYGRERGNII